MLFPSCSLLFASCLLPSAFCLGSLQRHSALLTIGEPEIAHPIAPLQKRIYNIPVRIPPCSSIPIPLRGKLWIKN